jgi:hypothetical protein
MELSMKFGDNAVDETVTFLVDYYDKEAGVNENRR